MLQIIRVSIFSEMATTPPDLFISALHGPTVPSIDSSFSIQTYLPLAGCDPLYGMRSMTCDQYTLFSLFFRFSDKLKVQVGKFSNGAFSLNAQGPFFDVYTQSAGFEPTPSATLHLKIPLDAMSKLNLAFDITDGIAVGGHRQLNSHWTAHAQLRDTSGSFGLRFQPCGHMHASFGLAVNRPNSLKNLQASVSLETKQRATFSLLGVMDTSSLHAFRIAATLPPKGPVVMSANYDLATDRMYTYADIKLATPPISINFRVGIETKSFNTPRFSLHINATEQ